MNPRSWRAVAVAAVAASLGICWTPATHAAQRVETSLLAAAALAAADIGGVDHG